MKTVLIVVMLAVLAGCAPMPLEKTIIASDNAPAAIGPYSQAVRVGNMLYLSGQLGMVPETGDFAEGGIEAQARQALSNQRAVLETAGFTLEDVVQCQVFITDMDNYPVFNGVYQEFFEADFPARAVVEVSRLPKDGLVEIMMVAVKTG
jgi:2-iminobutanoate/2-iminopropanoate deaminase